jgi:hypothetical protein
MWDKELVKKVFALRVGGNTYKEIGKLLQMTAGEVMQITKSEEYNAVSFEYSEDVDSVTDLVFKQVALDYAKHSQTLLLKILELIDSESPKIVLEGCKLLASQINVSRANVISTRISAIEDELSRLEGK